MIKFDLHLVADTNFDEFLFKFLQKLSRIKIKTILERNSKTDPLNYISLKQLQLNFYDD